MHTKKDQEGHTTHDRSCNSSQHQCHDECGCRLTRTTHIPWQAVNGQTGAQQHNWNPRDHFGFLNHLDQSPEIVVMSYMRIVMKKITMIEAMSLHVKRVREPEWLSKQAHRWIHILCSNGVTERIHLTVCSYMVRVSCRAILATIAEGHWPAATFDVMM